MFSDTTYVMIFTALLAWIGVGTLLPTLFGSRINPLVMAKGGKSPKVANPPAVPPPPQPAQSASDAANTVAAQNQQLALQNHGVGMSSTILTSGSGVPGYASTVKRRTLLSDTPGPLAGDSSQRLGS